MPTNSTKKTFRCLKQDAHNCNTSSRSALLLSGNGYVSFGLALTVWTGTECMAFGSSTLWICSFIVARCSHRTFWDQWGRYQVFNNSYLFATSQICLIDCLQYLPSYSSSGNAVQLEDLVAWARTVQCARYGNMIKHDKTRILNAANYMSSPFRPSANFPVPRCHASQQRSGKSRATSWGQTAIWSFSFQNHKHKLCLYSIWFQLHSCFGRFSNSLARGSSQVNATSSAKQQFKQHPVGWFVRLVKRWKSTNAAEKR